MSLSDVNIEVTIVIPCYNAEDTIISTLESVFKQTFTNYDVVIVDDGSTDSSLIIISNFLENNPNNSKVTVLSQMNMGPSHARNNGIALAKGKWVAFLDSDDCWNENKLRVQLEASIYYPDAVLVAVAYDKRKFSEEIKIQQITFRQLLLKNYFSTPAVMVKKEILRMINFDEKQKYSEDYGVWLMIAAQYKCIYINEVLCKSVTNKKQFGASGLSAQLWLMQKGEWLNYTKLYKMGYINFIKLIFCYLFSYFKYILRIIRSKAFSL